MGATLNNLFARPLMALTITVVLVMTADWEAQAAPEEEIVPSGVFRVLVSESSTTQTEAIDRRKTRGPLKNYLLPDNDLRDATTGAIQRTRSETELRLTFGLSNAWNISLRLPYLQLEQNSTLQNETTNPEEKAHLATLENASISGLGDLRLSLLYRPVYNDRNGLIWSFGWEKPSAGGDIPFSDSTSLTTTNHVHRYLVLMQYTRYTAVIRGRYDLSFRWSEGLPATVETTAGNQQKLKPGADIKARMGWVQEFHDFSFGVESDYGVVGQNSLGGELLRDNSYRWNYRLQVGYGNLSGLEKGPVAFPYRLLISKEGLVRGFNTVADDITILSLETFF